MAKWKLFGLLVLCLAGFWVFSKLAFRFMVYVFDELNKRK